MRSSVIVVVPQVAVITVRGDHRSDCDVEAEDGKVALVVVTDAYARHVAVVIPFEDTALTQRTVMTPVDRDCVVKHQSCELYPCKELLFVIKRIQDFNVKITTTTGDLPTAK